MQNSIELMVFSCQFNGVQLSIRTPLQLFSFLYCHEVDTTSLCPYLHTKPAANSVKVCLKILRIATPLSFSVRGSRATEPLCIGPFYCWDMFPKVAGLWERREGVSIGAEPEQAVTYKCLSWQAPTSVVASYTGKHPSSGYAEISSVLTSTGVRRCKLEYRARVHRDVDAP